MNSFASSYHQQTDEPDDDTFPAFAVKCAIEFQVFLDQQQRIPQIRPVGGERDDEKGDVNSDEDPRVIEMFYADVEQFGGRHVGSDFVGFQPQNAVNERGAMESKGG